MHSTRPVTLSPGTPPDADPLHKGHHHRERCRLPPSASPPRTAWVGSQVAQRTLRVSAGASLRPAPWRTPQAASADISRPQIAHHGLECMSLNSAYPLHGPPTPSEMYLPRSTRGETARVIDEEIRRIVDEAYHRRPSSPPTGRRSSPRPMRSSWRSRPCATRSFVRAARRSPGPLSPICSLPRPAQAAAVPGRR